MSIAIISNIDNAIVDVFAKLWDAQDWLSNIERDGTCTHFMGRNCYRFEIASLSSLTYHAVPVGKRFAVAQFGRVVEGGLQSLSRAERRALDWNCGNQ